MKTMVDSHKMTGTNAERLLLVPGNDFISFYETDTNAEYEWKGMEWSLTKINGVSLTSKNVDGTYTALLTNATGTGTSYSTQLHPPGKAEALYVATLGANNTIAATATVIVYGSLQPMATALAAEKVAICTLTLSGTGVTDNTVVVSTDYSTPGAHYWPYVWAEVTAITGTGATVQCGRNT